ncbi:MAG: TetR/AcrR family transcriptional regulator [Intestinibacillus sp.]
MAQTEDRRIRRTKRLLRQALAELMLEKEFKDITVTDVVDRADINRGTFYVHYRDVYDLREKIENEMIADFRSMLTGILPSPEHQSLRPVLEQAVDYLEENREMVCSLLRAVGSDGFKDKMMRIIEECRLSVSNAPREKESYIAQYIASGVIGVLSKWLLQENRLSRVMLIDMLDELLGKTLLTAG